MLSDSRAESHSLLVLFRERWPDSITIVIQRPGSNTWHVKRVIFTTHICCRAAWDVSNHSGAAAPIKTYIEVWNRALPSALRVTRRPTGSLRVPSVWQRSYIVCARRVVDRTHPVQGSHRCPLAVARFSRCLWLVRVGSVLSSVRYLPRRASFVSRLTWPAASGVLLIIIIVITVINASLQ